MAATDRRTATANASEPEPLAYKLQDVARLLSLSYRKVRYMADSGELPVFKVGRVRRVKASVVQEYIEQQASERRAS